MSRRARPFNAPARRWRSALTAFIALIFMLPLWWVAISALRPEAEIFRYLSPLSWQTLLPTQLTADHFVQLWQGSFRLAIFNSMLVAAVTLVLGLFVCSIAAFALAVIDFPGRRFVFPIMVVSFLIPFDAIAVPLLGIVRRMDLQNTYIALILPGIGNGLAVFLLRQFFLGIPKDLLEAARVDGLGWFGIYRQIYLPLSVPALISAGLILFVFQWQAYLWPLLVAPATEYKVGAVAIAQMSDPYLTNNGPVFAAALCLSLIPMLVLTIFQRNYIASVATTGGKG